MLTRAKIAYNLAVSPHKHEVSYENGQSVIYYFSSDLYKKKFMERMTEHRDVINASLSKRFGLGMKCDLLGDIRLYSTIEKRGFLMTVDGVEYTWQNNIRLDGLKVIQNS